MGLVRFAAGRDAADAAFAALFGSVAPGVPIIGIQAVPNGQGELVTPLHGRRALASDGA
jgi:hypothetical protein